MKSSKAHQKQTGILRLHIEIHEQLFRITDESAGSHVNERRDGKESHRSRFNRDSPKSKCESKSSLRGSIEIQVECCDFVGLDLLLLRFVLREKRENIRIQ